MNTLPLSATNRLSIDKLIQKVEAENNSKNESFIVQLRQLSNLIKSNPEFVGIFVFGTALFAGVVLFIIYGPDSSNRPSGVSLLMCSCFKCTLMKRN